MKKKLKNSLREKIRKLRKSISEKEKKDASINNKLENLPEFKKAKKILLYYSMAEEVSTKKIIKKYINKKEIFLPRVSKDIFKIHKISECHNLVASNLGVKEPHKQEKEISPSELDLVIVPGIAFDKNKNRLGFGGGFYDKFLKKIKCKTIALAYKCQIVENIPCEDHDQKVDLIISE